MSQWGGYRKPNNPAPVSGPGAASRRTDGAPKMELSDANYGEQKTFQEVQGGGQLGQAPPSTSAPAPSLPPLVGLDAPSQQPGVPVTDGADAGPGSGSDALGILAAAKADAAHFAKYMPVLIEIADKDSTPPSVKRAIRQLYANM